MLYDQQQNSDRVFEIFLLRKIIYLWSERGVVGCVVVGILHRAPWVRSPLPAKIISRSIQSLSPRKKIAHQRVVSCIDKPLCLAVRTRLTVRESKNPTHHEYMQRGRDAQTLERFRTWNDEKLFLKLL